MPLPGLRVLRLNQRQQPLPGDHRVHLGQEPLPPRDLPLLLPRHRCKRRLLHRVTLFFLFYHPLHTVSVIYDDLCRASLGLELARRHPEWLYAYIGTGQVTNSPESERRGWAFALAAARAAHNEQAVAELQSIAPYGAPGKAFALKDVIINHKWSDFYGGVMAYRTSQEDESQATRLSPDYTDAEAPHIFDGNEYSERFLLADLLNMDLSQETVIDCPVILLEGRQDRTTNATLAYEWFKRVKAPTKRFVWFEHSAHEPESEEPGKFLLSLVSYALPLATGGGQVQP